eukprot:TRINITY_DN13383_c0_g1_i1.p1 TRINITY_DN13383_c0_g1~~TRINITY_DN13383_c0_g1_i1.p1  ORF type:complete len:217 (+),score=47.64 TRINITY_DN13383_c0_g1_i1:770-1420(+)
MAVRSDQGEEKKRTLEDWEEDQSEIDGGILHVASPVFWQDETYEAEKAELEEDVLKQEEDHPQGIAKMTPFPADQTDWKKILYNLLVENHNEPSDQNPIYPLEVEVEGTLRSGFAINTKSCDPKKFLAELYAARKRQGALKDLDPVAPATQALYTHYSRAADQLMSKYFDRVGKHVYAYGDTPLFIPGGELLEAADRIKGIETKSRRKKRAKNTSM